LADLAKATLAKDFTNIDPRDTRVVLVEAVDTLLNAYPAHLGAYTVGKLTDLGVEVHTN
ncbi:MAG TPA: FAD-dependent oxidoreductase, partial [Pelagibacterium sp.]|nr:FAD-dependent oxidoreductase [Pelagibacterium sp.]